jgi:hypothetical protein
MASCDAGHGCTIACTGGCGAVWVEPNGPCHTFCDDTSVEVPKDVSKAEKFSIEINDLRISQLINVLPVDLGFEDQDQEQRQRGEKRISLRMHSTSRSELTAELKRHLA